MVEWWNTGGPTTVSIGNLGRWEAARFEVGSFGRCGASHELIPLVLETIGRHVDPEGLPVLLGPMDLIEVW